MERRAAVLWQLLRAHNHMLRAGIWVPYPTLPYPTFYGRPLRMALWL